MRHPSRNFTLGASNGMTKLYPGLSLGHRQGKDMKLDSFLVSCLK